MPKLCLTYLEDAKTGDLGFYIQGASLNPEEYSMAYKGSVTAHDIVEHENIEKIGSIGDELNALGAVWFVRGESCALGNNYFGPDEALASDVLTLAREYYDNREDGFGEPIPLVNPSEEVNEKTFTWMINYAKRNIISELDEEGEETNIWDSLTPFFTHAIKFMLDGYNRAYATWDGKNHYALGAFTAIQEAVDKALRRAEWEGQEFELTYDLAKGTASCFEVEYPEEEE